jgi:hypothetical protein
MSPSASGLVGSPTIEASHFSPLAAAHSSSFIVPLMAGPSSSPVISSEIEPFGPPFDSTTRHRGDETGDAALHVDGAATEHLALCDLGGERRMRPRGLVTDRHHVCVPGEHQMRPVAGAARIEVFDIGRASFRKHRALDGKAEWLQHCLQRAQGSTFGRRDGGAADQGGQICGGVGRQGHGQSDSRKSRACHGQT